MTTVQELMAELIKLDPTLELVVSKDGEGNDFRPFWCIQKELYSEEDRYVIAPEDARDYPDTDFKKVAVIWPV